MLVGGIAYFMYTKKKKQQEAARIEQERLEQIARANAIADELVSEMLERTENAVGRGKQKHRTRRRNTRRRNTRRRNTLGKKSRRGKK